MTMKKALCCTGLIACALLCGCRRYVFADKPTPGAPLEPPRPAPLAPTGTTTHAPRTPLPSEDRDTPSRLLSGVRRREPLPAAISAAFTRAYRDRESPRIAVYFNRALSDRVSEWVTGQRAVLEGGYRRDSDWKGKESGQGDLTLSVQQQRQQAGRASPSEAWMWAFEEGFMKPYLEAGVTLVDRAVMLRLTAAERTGGKAPDRLTIETDALQGHADVLVELLIRRDPKAVCGYDFRAIAKQVRDGRVLGLVSSREWDDVFDPRRKKAIATADGYETVYELPSVEETAALLAIDLSQSLEKTWAADD